MFLPTVASTALLPTRAEITAGTDLTPNIAATDGWTLENQPIETPDMASTFVSKIGGDDSAADSSLTMYEDETADDVETDLAKGTDGFIAIFSKGDIAAAKGLDVFPVTVVSNSKAYVTDNEAAKITVQFTITARPAFNQTVPAMT
ncbi:phage tail tube protein [Streptomyces sp. NPDC001658]